MRKIFIFMVSIFLVVSLTAGCSGNQDNAQSGNQNNGQEEEIYPNQPIKLVVGRGPGGSHDLHARVITSTITEYLGVPMIVELKGGGSGSVGAEYVATTKADGYTLLFGGVGSETTLFHVRDLPYNRDDFIPIAKINDSATVIAVKDDSPFNTMEELFEYAKANPGELTYGSSGTFGSSHFPIEMIADAQGLDMVHVPFDGGGPNLMALLGGSVDFIGGMPSTLKDQHDSGAIRILTQMSTERSKMLPDVPTMNELGYDIEYANWRTVFAPAGTPDERVQILREAFGALMEDASFQKMIGKLGEEIKYLDGPDFQVVWDKEFASQEVTAKRLGADEQ